MNQDAGPVPPRMLEVAAEALDENDETGLVNPKVMGVLVFAGIGVLDKRALVVTVDDAGGMN